MTQRLLLISITILVLSLALTGCISNNSEESETINAVFVVDGEETDTLTLEVADTSSEREKGLMNRTDLPSDHGMIFVFPDEDIRNFWMKNTYIPLDMIFLDSDQRVINIEHADPEPDTSDFELEDITYSSEEPAMYVVEVNRGYSNETGLGPGDELRIIE